jgi:hypothetical protein
MSTTDANDHPTAAAAAPRRTPGRAYWLLTTAVLPMLGVVALGGIAAITDATLGDSYWNLGVLAATAAVACVTTVAIAYLPALRTMTPGRRAGYCLLSMVLQIAITYVLVFVAVIAALVIACETGHCPS